MKPNILLTLSCSCLLLSCALEQFPDEIPAPVACFTADKNSCTTDNCQISFDASCSENAVSYSWDFGDGTSASGAIVSHIYNSAGAYNIVLTVSNAPGIIDTINQSINVLTDSTLSVASCTDLRLLAKFDISNNNCKAPCEISIDNTSENAISYSWNFGDGQLGEGAFPTHEYTKPGSYNITLVASNGECRDSLIKPVNIEWLTFSLAYFGVCRFVAQNQDGGYTVTGNTGSVGANDIFLFSTGQEGNLVRDETYGNPLDDEISESFVQTTDGGYIVVGFAKRQDQEFHNLFIGRTNNEGKNYDTTWVQTNLRGRGRANAISKSLNGGYIITGFIFNSRNISDDIFLLNINSDGEVNFENIYEVEGKDEAHSVFQTSDGGFIIAGSTFNSPDGSQDAIIIKTNDTGVKEWEQTFGGSQDDIAFSIKETTDGGYVFTGMTNSMGKGGDDIYLVKTSNLGSMVWEKNYGNVGDDEALSILQTADEGFILAGSMEKSGSNHAYIIKVDNNGEKEWDSIFEDNNSPSYFSEVFQSSDGGFVISGWSPGYLIKTDNKGNVN